MIEKLGHARLLEEIPLVIDEIRMPLRRFASQRGSVDRGRQPVLLLHGGNTNSRLYHEPHGGLVRYLAERGCDVWTLDWRASAEIQNELIREQGPLYGDVVAERKVFSLDRVAQEDIPAALREMRKHGVEREISVLGFCLAGGALAKSVARGHLEGLGVGDIVLATMGLFYEVPWNGWIKAEDFLLERVLSSDVACRSIDPFHPERWPAPLVRAYEAWPKQWLGATGTRPIDELFRRLTFCYGEPYARARLDPRFEEQLNEQFFGPIHLGVFLHAGQMIRRGYSAKLDALDVIDRSRIDTGSRQVPDTDLLPEHFKTKRVTVLTGSDDRLWHRDSCDLMYEWLRNECTNRSDPAVERRRHAKCIVPRYGHLDIFWGKDAKEDVYRHFLSALTRSELDPALAKAAE